jgi:hypothetical protein
LAEQDGFTKNYYDYHVYKAETIMANSKNPNAAVAAIQFALKAEEGLEFLRCWNEGNFVAIRKEWPEAPEEVFIGADPLYSATA